MSEGKQRKKRDKEAMVHVNLRLPKKVLDYYKRDAMYTRLMRNVLVQFAEDESDEKLR